MSTAAILAGGRARRFGGQAKALLPLGQQRIIDGLLAAVRVVADDVLIVLNRPHGAERETYLATGAAVIEDQFTDAGPLGGLHAALTASGSAQTLVAAGDMPFLTSPFLAHLLAVAHDDASADAVLPRTGDGWHPLCAVYRASCIGTIEDRIAGRALRTSGLVDHLRTRAVATGDLAPFDTDGTLLFNVNTPADYARALAINAYRTDPRNDPPHGA